MNNGSSLKWVRSRRHAIPSWISLFVLFFLVLPALADEVRLKNGDRLTGEIVSMEKEVLTLKTPYAGDVTLKREEVGCITSDRELTVRLKDGQVLIGRAVCPADGQIQVVGVKVGESAEMSLDELEAINPSPPPPAITYKANLTAGGSSTSGNTDEAAFYFSAGFQARSKRHRLTLAGKYNYGETDGEVTQRNALGRIKYDLFVTEKLYAYAQGLFETDEFADLNLRSTMGLGAGYQLFDTERTSLFIEAGVSYFSEDFDIAEDDSYFSARESTGFEFAIVPERIRFFHLHEFYYSLEESDSYYLFSEQGFRFLLFANFFANFELDYSYTRQPAPGKENSDTTFIASLGYELNF